MENELNKDGCIVLLRQRAEQLGRLPVRADFEAYEVMKIKAYFGPWPRALEAAGLKERSGTDRLERNRQKRARAKARLREYIKGERGEKHEENS